MKINLKKRIKYIVGVSYGPDSMALLDMLIKEKFNIVVCYVNYHLREESNFEEESLIKYLKENNVKYYVKEAFYNLSYKNIEAWARKVRYNFFKEICKKEMGNHIVIAHNKDDLLETYLIQKRRKSIVSYYGLNKEYKDNNYYIHRPLLNFKKAELLQYCNENNIPYAIDKSNFDSKYLRNDIRINIVSKYSNEERNLLLKEIKSENRILKNRIEKLKPLIEKTLINREEILNLNINEFNLLIVEKLKRVGISYGFSLKFSEDIYNKIKNNKYFVFKNEHFSIYYSENLFLISQNIINPYMYFIFNLEKEDIFRINKKSKLYKELKDKMVIIKPVDKKEIIKIKDGNKKISRLFIDQHMPLFLREIWPGVYDQNNNLLYTPHYQNNFSGKGESVIIFDVLELIKCFLLYKIK